MPLKKGVIIPIILYTLVSVLMLLDITMTLRYSLEIMFSTHAPLIKTYICICVNHDWVSAFTPCLPYRWLLY